MEQRTCNIIECCKGNSKIPLTDDRPLQDLSIRHQAIAAYMSRECACPMESYVGYLLEDILKEALFDYIGTADKPGAELRNLFARGRMEEPTMSERIMTLFQLAQVRQDGKLINGFTEQLLAQSKKDLAEEGNPVWTANGLHMHALTGKGADHELGADLYET